MSDMERLIERLQTGLQPTEADVPSSVRCLHMSNWRWQEKYETGAWCIVGHASEYDQYPDLLTPDQDVYCGPVVWIDARQRWAVTERTFMWLT
jgi:hypothetical protein